MFKNALVSVSDKTGLVEFLQPLVKKGLRVVSTGGTSQFLRKAGIPVVEVAEQTGFPEVMDGRVRTLHPRIHMPLLARSHNAEDARLLKENGLEPFDLVIVNLYPFEQSLLKGLQGEELIEQIDIGGPSLLRAAAKSFERVAVVCNPQDYSWLAEQNELTSVQRQKLAAAVYEHTSRYDALIARTLNPEKTEASFLAGEVVQTLRYGENPHQQAWWMRLPGEAQGLHKARILHGKALSYNNLLDLQAALNTVRTFPEACAVAVKHNNPCGVAIGGAIHEAVGKALKADPISVFGGIVAVNRTLNLAAAEMLSALFLECVIAPAYEPSALEKLQKKKDLRLMEWPELADYSAQLEFKTVDGGYLLQTVDQVESWSDDWKVFGAVPDGPTRQNLLLAWRVSAQLKSNAIAIAADNQTIGLGMGQVNRVEAVAQAIERMQKHHPGVHAPVLASDAFFPFSDSIEHLAQAGIRWVIQPGGSIRDEQVILKAQELGVNMIFTGIRHFRH